MRGEKTAWILHEDERKDRRCAKIYSILGIIK